MPQSLASRSQFLEISAAMSRHPASAGAAGPPSFAAVAGPASFATVAALLTGPWRVNDPVGFAAAMRAAPLVAGYPVVDLCVAVRQSAAGLDPLSAAVAGHLESAVSAAPGRSTLAVRWVAARAGSDLYVEAAGRAPAGADGPELLVLGHLVEPLAGGAAAGDDSWVVAVVGDGRGAVAGVARVAVPAGGRVDRRVAVRLNLGALRGRLAGPALAAEGLGRPASEPVPEGVVLPFRR
jgi:hypothetical protein